MNLRHMFDLELQHTGPVPREVPTAGMVGDPIGSGHGRIEGEGIRGTVRWSLFERRHPGGVCDANHVGVIETDDGARIDFDTLGFYKQHDPPNQSKWSLAAGLRFHTRDDCYRWLNKIPSLLEGELDMETGRTVARAYARVARCAEEALAECSQGGRG